MLNTDTQIRSLIKNNAIGKHAAGSGLYLKIAKERTSFWLYRFTIFKKRREMTLGRYPQMSLHEARKQSAHYRELVQSNIDPLAEKHRLVDDELKTVDDLAAVWLADLDKRLKHPGIPRRVFRKDISPFIGAMPIERIRPTDIRAIIIKIAESDRPSIANDALQYCKQLFRFGIKLDLLSTNPADAFSYSDAGGIEKSRSRALTVNELKILFKCLRDNQDQFVRENFLAIILLVHLGIRKTELINAEWSEVDLSEKVWNVPADRTKTKVAIRIPLTDLAHECFKELRVRATVSNYVFPNRRASKRFGHISADTLNHALLKLFKQHKLTIEHFTIHDLRRTCRSLLAQSGVPSHVAERCLNHKIKGVEGIYDRYDYFDERLNAMKNIEKILNSVLFECQS